MKKLSLLTLFLMPLLSAKGQEYRVGNYAGYGFGDHVDAFYNDTSYYNGKINGSIRWGVSIEYSITSDIGFGLAYLRQKMQAPIYYYDRVKHFSNFRILTNWILLQSVYRKRQADLEEYLSAEGGPVFIHLEDPESGASRSAVRLAWGLKLGTNLLLTDRIGLNIQAAFHSITRGIGGEFYFGQTNSGNYILGYSVVTSFSVGGGLVFKFPMGKKEK